MNRDPRTTEALAPFTDLSMVQEDALAAACARGTAVHGYCTDIALGMFVPSVEERFRGYVDSFLEWVDLCVERFVLVEKRLTHSVYHYSGQPDLFLVMKGDNGRVMCIDLKTPITHYLSWRLQLASYRELGIDYGLDVHRAGSLRLSPTGGRAKLKDYDGTFASDFAVFLCAKTCWHFFHTVTMRRA